MLTVAQLSGRHLFTQFKKEELDHKESLTVRMTQFLCSALPTSKNAQCEANFMKWPNYEV